MTEPAKDLKEWIEKEFFHAVPVFIAALDRELNIIYANKAFEDKFGDWRGKKCFDVYKKRDAVCENCSSRFAFSNAKTSVSEQTGYSKNGRLIHYIKYTIPVADASGQVKYLVEISTETTLFKETEKEYKLLFEKVPCNIIIINRDFKIVRANKKAENIIRNLQGEFCYSALKGRSEKCLECNARKTFEDGMQHTGNHVWKLTDGRTIDMHVITILLKGEEEQQDMVMEMAVDISRTIKLQNRLEDAHHYLESLINTSMDGIVGISQKGKVEVFNIAARSLFNISPGQVVSLEDLNTMLPHGFLASVSKERSHVFISEAELKRSDGEKFMGRLIGNKLKDSDKNIGMAFSVHDISQLKKLEEEKIEAERMAIVGQTVAGLAHGIKNLINALEGGMYFLTSGIGNGDIKRVHKGIETLKRNIERIRNFSKSFLNYARVRDLELKDCNPADIINEVLESFTARSQENDIGLDFIQDRDMDPVSMDYEKIHEALTNLVGNAFDAFTDIEDTRKKEIKIRLFEEEGAIFIEVSDNACGIDEEQRKRLFKKFFTTKGLKGTGLGLLMTQKIIHEHGGRISVISKKGEGAVFRIRLLKSRLPKQPV
jgi:histidine kinase